MKTLRVNSGRVDEFERLYRDENLSDYFHDADVNAIETISA
jgi:hypothetical protein